MKFDHIVNYNGVYYAAGEDVPIEAKKVSAAEKAAETSPAMYTSNELEELPVRRIRELAAEKGFEITSSIKADVINEFLEKQVR